MNPAGRWERYERDCGGAWHAIDDLRDVVGELVDQRDIRNEHRFTAFQLAAIIVSAVAAIATASSLILAFVPHA